MRNKTLIQHLCMGMGPWLSILYHGIYVLARNTDEICNIQLVNGT